ncbi:porin family protein [Emcibacter sp.]|uniref:porin family protein n=1 Tax=Emcibacter sp. TaxID=1979954 RepID=UPI002AA7DC44|nr:porin family protein [Emcibacter sp.]
MKNFLFALAGVAALSTATAAFAEENSFAGPYVGVEVGYNDLDFDAGTANVGANGFNYGLFAGYRYQVGSSLLLGLEARAGESTASLGDETASIDAGRQLGVDATIGTTLGTNNNILAFAFVGYENARLTANVGNESDAADMDGIRFGAGTEYAFTKNLSVRATLAYTDYESDVSNIQILTGLVYNF